MIPNVISSFSFGLLALLAVPPARAVESPAPPRYRLKVGQELVYAGASRFKFENGAHGTKDKTTFWVTRKNDDGSWHIIAHNENTFSQSHGNADAALSPGRTEEAFGAFDLYPDGRVTNAPHGFREQRLPNTFVRLPADLVSARAGWEVKQEDGDTSRFRLAPQSDPASGKWDFEKTDHGVYNEVYLSTSKALIHFDGKRGVIAKVESENTQGYGFNGKGTGTVELKSITQKSPAWIAQLAREADLLFQAKGMVREAAKAGKKYEDREKADAAAQPALRDGRDKVKLPMIQTQFDAQLAAIKSSATDYAEEKKLEAAVLNKPAAEWNTVDIDGKNHTLAGYRGKVIVLDFWYRGCGWCIKAMPQIKEVVEHYAGKPVVVLGMNTDREDKDARFVVDKLKLNYATLKAKGLPEKYSVQGFPTLIVIDQKGIVRVRHVGYSPSLREELVKQIDGLLASEK